MTPLPRLESTTTFVVLKSSRCYFKLSQSVLYVNDNQGIIEINSNENQSSLNTNKMVVLTNENMQELAIPNKSTGYGSSVNGGELLLLSLATCFCHDINREAGRRDIKTTNISVEVSNEFAHEGEPGFNINYAARIDGDAPQAELEELIVHTNKVAEIQKYLKSWCIGNSKIESTFSVNHPRHYL